MKLPKTLYVMVAGEDDDQYFQASDKLEGAVEDDGPTKVGCYRLERIDTFRKDIVRDE